MKHLILLLSFALTIISCGKTEEKKEALYPVKELSAEEQKIAWGKELFDGSKATCYSCHRPDKKVIGPSIAEIAKIYKEQNGDMKAFLLEKAEPIVDPAQYATMKTNFNVTKNLPEEELEAIIAYMMSY